MKVNKKILELVQRIQALALEVNNVILYYQQNVNIFQVYILENAEYKYNKSVYLDGSFSDKETIVRELKEIIEYLKGIKEEN